MQPAIARTPGFRTVWVAVAALAIAALVIATGTGCASTQKAPENWDGLKLVKHEGLDLVYVRPGAKLIQYTSVMLDPLQVSFDKNWKPEQDEVFRTQRIDPQKIRQELAREFREVSRRELEEGRYAIVDEPGADVLRVSPAIVNLYITAPDTMEPGSFNLVAESGSMTLVAELRDSTTNSLLARVVDREDAPSTATLHVADSVTNSADARTAIAMWADALRTALNNAHEQVAIAPTAPASTRSAAASSQVTHGE